MRVLISEGDWIYRERIMELQTQVFGIKVLLEKPDVQSIIAAFKEYRPEVVILGLQLTSGNIIDLLKKIYSLQFTGRLIILFNPLFSEYQEELKKYHATYISNSLLDFHKVIRILVSIQHNLDELKGSRDDRDKEEVVIVEVENTKPQRRLV